MKNIFGCVVLFFCLFILGACEGPEGPQGPEGPVLAINTINATPFTLNPGNTATVTTDYIYSGGNTIEFSWESTDGTFIGEINTAIVEWKSPFTSGYYTISLTISDGEIEAIGHCTIQVIDSNDFYWCDIPAGEYTYGEGDTIKTIEYDYQIMKYEVTNTQYVSYLVNEYAAGDIWFEGEDIMGFYEGDEYYPSGDYVLYYMGTPSSFNYGRISWDGESFVINVPAGYDSGDFDNHPVVEVTWFGAWAFAKHYAYRLPTEYEWEKAARGNTGYDYPWGDDIDGSRANYSNSGDPWDNGTTPAGMYNGQTIQGFQTTDNSSPYGLSDMAGNVWNWTCSWYGGDYPSARVRRSGSFIYSQNNLRSWIRYCDYPTSSWDNKGFRCVRL